MLVSAALYKNEIEELELLSMNDIDKMYWHGGPYRSLPDINSLYTENAYGRYSFACINSKNEVTGYLTYHLNYESMSASYFGIINYLDKPNPLLVKDTLEHINTLFTKRNLNRIGWMCYEDNPFLDSYKRIIKKYGGRIVGINHQTTLLEDGCLHNEVIFEILKGDWHYEK